jgi:hypothetical protein
MSHIQRRTWPFSIARINAWVSSSRYYTRVLPRRVHFPFHGTVANCTTISWVFSITTVFSLAVHVIKLDERLK